VGDGVTIGSTLKNAGYTAFSEFCRCSVGEG
jgi:hypothetical protein